MTLTELLVVVAIMAILLGISVPTAQHLKDSFESSTGVRYLINAALSNARAIAVRQQKYAGVRFQEDAEGHTYMIFIVHDTPANTGGLEDGFRAVVGRNPMKLPEDVGVLANVFSSSNTDSQNNALIDTDVELTDAKTFSIIFSSAGKLVIHDVRVRNKDGKTDGSSNDTIFNEYDFLNNEYLGMFLQDDYPAPLIPANPDWGLAEEGSIQGFIIFDKKEIVAVSANSRWTDYFSKLQIDYISPYTGELIMEYREESP